MIHKVYGHQRAESKCFEGLFSVIEAECVSSSVLKEGKSLDSEEWVIMGLGSHLKCLSLTDRFTVGVRRVFYDL